MLLANMNEIIPESLGERGVQKDPGRLKGELILMQVEMCSSSLRSDAKMLVRAVIAG